MPSPHAVIAADHVSDVDADVPCNCPSGQLRAATRDCSAARSTGFQRRAPSPSFQSHVVLVRACLEWSEASLADTVAVHVR